MTNSVKDEYAQNDTAASDGESGSNDERGSDAGHVEATNATTALRANNISRSFGDVSVFSNLSFGVERGEVFSLVGPNGSGKSTLLEVLAGVRPTSTGSVTVSQREDGVREVGYLPQRPSFRDGFTARDTLDFYARFLDGVGDDEVTETLERVGLSGVADRSVGSLSGGMTRLLGLGQAVLGDPAVLVLDEPGSGLDPAMVERLFGIVGELAQSGSAVVVASHELPAIETYADTVAVLDGGEFVARGTPESLLSQAEADTLPDAFLRLVGAEAGSVTVRADATSREATR
ncbi:multidrug ABC transporter ATPase [Halogeometricum borinquense DSM 11551]|uniref:ABC-type multidrug transport system, ATPase component n=1 Tax=Halogeometricum borinquense (strain ATCC 700274 / DSM 11551 / JCM 10706 / KCTC 4070 / PR3) TaxID=469382 RepID=E4NQU3_HALBP|nr:ABC transporter ATP-binding protein [Halogeometricum borinquense]ADQ67890.1 ABC-type multidrug transport system, ATPase component [Halogeometricum borinquense DSM 11551]ELY24190.1 multidrug ABC transporter ATPase [Halogeometricum borinquense DSM 11551]